MMFLLPRKSLLADQTFQKFPSHCYLCYICPDDCYARSPPSPPPAAPSNVHHLSTFLVLMLCLLGLASLVLSYMTIRRYRCNSRRPDSLGGLEDGEFRGPRLEFHPPWFIRTVGLSQAVIESIPVFNFKKYGNLIEGKDCSVCLSEFQEDERIRVLPKCRHSFHLQCIDPWLRSQTNCPVCRTIVVVGPEDNSLLSGDENQVPNELETPGRMEVEESGEIPGVHGNLGVLTGLADRFQGGRRAMSLDFSSEFMINEMVEEPDSGKRGFKNLSGRFLHKGPVLIKRSFSFSGKRSARKNNDNRQNLEWLGSIEHGVRL